MIQSEKSSYTGLYIILGLLVLFFCGCLVVLAGYYLIGVQPIAPAYVCPSPVTPTPAAEISTQRIYRTVMNGKLIQTAQVAFNSATNQPYIQFTLTDAGTKIFAGFTANNIGKFLAIVANKKVISSPRVNSAITQGSGIIEGRFTRDEAIDLAMILKNCAELVEFVDAGETALIEGDVIQTTGP